MANITKIINTWKYSSQREMLVPERQGIITEQSVCLIVNGEFWLNFICSPIDLEALAVGFLWNEDVIQEVSEIQNLTVSPDLSTIEVTLRQPVVKPQTWHRTTTGVVPTFTSTQAVLDRLFRISAKSLIAQFASFESKQTNYHSAGGYHSAALSDGESVCITVEDIGRHNCLDKVIGIYLLEQKPFTPQIMLLTGRVSSEMIHKTLKLNVPVIASRTTPTANAVEIALANLITLVGYLRGERFTIFANPERIIFS